MFYTYIELYNLIIEKISYLLMNAGYTVTTLNFDTLNLKNGGLIINLQ